MIDPTTPAVKGTQPPLSDPQPQRPVSEAPTPQQDDGRCDRCGQPEASHRGLERFCPFYSTYRAERVRTAPPQEDATSPLDLTLARREGARVDEEWLSNLLAAWDMVGLDLGDSQVSELVDGLAAALGQSRASAALRPSAPSSAPTTEEKP